MYMYFIDLIGLFRCKNTSVIPADGWGLRWPHIFSF